MSKQVENTEGSSRGKQPARVLSQHERGGILAAARGTFRENEETRLALTGDIPLSPGSTLCDEKEDLFLNALSRAYKFAKTRRSSGFEESQLSPEELLDAVVGERELKDAHRDLVVPKMTARTKIIHLALPFGHWACDLAIAVLEDRTLAGELRADMSQFSVSFVGGELAEPVQLWPAEEEPNKPFDNGDVIEVENDDREQTPARHDEDGSIDQALASGEGGEAGAAQSS